MSSKIIIYCVAMVGTLLPLINCSPGIMVHKDNPQFQRVRDMLSEVAKNRTVPADKYFWWNPTLITDDPSLSSICSNNAAGNYQNPFDCQQFIMCSGNEVWLWYCPGGLIYDPIPDLCVYRPTPPNTEECPWPSIWQDPAQVRCDSLGQRPWWSPLAFPTNPETRCGSEIFYCLKYNLLGYTSCPEGFGYSKAYLACLDMESCEMVDEAFGY